MARATLGLSAPQGSGQARMLAGCHFGTLPQTNQSVHKSGRKYKRLVCSEMPASFWLLPPNSKVTQQEWTELLSRFWSF